MRGGLKGFRVFLACLMLGVASIAAVGSLASAILEGIRENGQELLGGDVEVQSQHGDLGQQAQAYLATQGMVTRVVEMRAMGRAVEKDSRTLIQLKAVDSAYPLYGKLTLDRPISIADALAEKDGTWGALIDEDLVRRLGVHPGDHISVGDLTYEIRAIITDEPDRSINSISFGPRVMVSTASLAATHLIRVGSLVDYDYRLKLPAKTDLDKWKKTAGSQYPDEALRIRDRRDGAPSARRFVDRIGTFLTLVGLTALLVGGVGVGNAVKGYLDSRAETIATLKCIGAPAGMVFEIYLIQIMTLGLLGIAVGLVIGAGAPFVLADLIREYLPVPTSLGIYPKPLVAAAIYGALTALAFTIWPLARAREIPAAALFRDLVAPARRWPRARFILAVGVIAALIAAMAVLLADQRTVAIWFVISAVASFALLEAVAAAIAWLAARMGRPRNPRVRIALANLYRPGAATGSVVLSLGLGLTLFVSVAMIEGNLAAQIDEEIPADVPAFFFLDIQSNQIDAFDKAIASIPGAKNFTRVPTLRGTIVKIAGVPVEDADIDPGARWAVRGDRNLTYLTDLPAHNEVVSGKWWPKDYAGPPEISFDAGLARGMHVGVGDTITFNILGREIEAKIASLRAIDWSNATLNFAVVFAPGALDSAPHSYLGTVQAAGSAEPAIFRTITDQFPNVTTIRVKDVIDTLSKLLGQIGGAVRVAAAVTLLTGILVLAGAMAAGQRQRIYDAVVLKVLGATRPDVLKAYLLEYALLGILTAVVAMILGAAASWAVIDRLMEGKWVFLPSVMVVTALASLAVTVGSGLFGTWRALSQKPAPILRSN